MDNGFSSPRRDVFPAGLRVLVVDDDPTWLRILEKMLKKCSYEVTTCCLAREALNLLREKKDGYDIVISDVNMPDMDGFKLLEHVGLEMDLPVIMMSVDGETSRVMKGVQHGACDYLLKPIRMKELRNIWQHVFRKRIHEAREFESHEGFEGIHLMRNGLDHSDDGSLFSLEDMTSTRKRKDADSKHDDKDFGDSSTTKKARVVWSVDLHQKFVKAVNQIGFDKVGPKKILDLMNVPWLTRENVASHLQKYRLYLTRLQRENEQKSSSSGMKLSDLPTKDPMASFSFQNSVNGQQSDVAVDSYKYCDGTLPQNLNDSSHQGDVKGNVLEPRTEKRRSSFTFQNSVNGQQSDVAVDSYKYCDGTLPQNLNDTSHQGDVKGNVSEPRTEKQRSNNIPDSKIRSSQMSNNQFFPPLESESDHAIYDRTIPTEYSWSKVPGIQLKKENKSLLQVDDSFSQLPLHGTQSHIQVDQSQSVPSINSNPSVAEREVSGCVETKPLFTEFKNKYGSSVNSVGRAVDTFSIQSSNDLVNDQSLEAISTTNLGMKTLDFNLSCMSDLEFYQRNLPLGDEPGSAPLNEDVQLRWLSGEYYNMAFGLQNIEMPECFVPGLITEVPTHLYDSADYSLVDQGLYIA